MAIWEIKDGRLTEVPGTTFGAEKVLERRDLQAVIRENIEMIAPSTMVLAEEYGDWADSRRRIDLLGLDTNANLVVVELKRTEDGGLSDLQAVRYAAMVSTLTFAKATEAHQQYLEGLGREEDAEARILEFLAWDEPNENEFANEVSIVLASAEFSKEVTSTVLWLNEHGLDIRCVRLKPYRLDERLLLDVQQVLPLPEAAEYQVQVREKAVEKRRARSSGADFTRYDLHIKGETYLDLWKRWMVYRVVRAAIDAGASPEELIPLLHRGRTRWISVEGHVQSADFVAQVARMKLPRGSPCDPRRYFTDDDELIRSGGRTWAFSNQWGGERAFQAIDTIAKKYPQLAITYEETTQASSNLAS